MTRVVEVFCGRPVIVGSCAALAAVSRGGFNTYASFFTSLHGPGTQAICADAGNADLLGQDLRGRLICAPLTTGSTSAGAVWQRLARLDRGPAGLLLAEPIDSLAAGGLIVAQLWASSRCVVVDGLGAGFLSSVRSGERLRVLADGRVLRLTPS